MSGEAKLAEALRSLVAPIEGLLREREAKVDALLRLMLELHSMTPAATTADNPRHSDGPPTREDAEWRANGFAYAGPKWKTEARATARALLNAWLEENGLS